MRKFCRVLAVLSLMAAASLFGAMLFVDSAMPEVFSVAPGNGVEVAGNLSVVVPKEAGAGSIESLGAGDSYEATINLFSLFPVKTVRVDIVGKNTVVVGGTPFGIKMFTAGVVVVGLGEVETESGPISPAADAGIKVGDVIYEIGGKAVATNEDVGRLMRESGGKSVSVVLQRKNIEFTAAVTPVKAVSDGNYRAGIWVRDSSAGIGTMTFYSPQNGSFAGLGHAVCDVDTGELLPLMTGEIVDVAITDALKGEIGSAGELRGVFKGDAAVGRLTINCEMGVYGVMKREPEGRKAEIALKQEVKTGPATVITTISSRGPEEFQIEIEKVNLSLADTKNMVIRITDPKLLEATGGIVHGMSGSPILQGGKLVGAVTHVFVSDPKKGYAIFAENMLKTSEKVENPQYVGDAA